MFPLDELTEAAHVLSGLGLVTAFGHVSARDGTSMLITPAADLGAVTAQEIVRVPLDATAQTGLPALRRDRPRPAAERLRRRELHHHSQPGLRPGGLAR